ncbi:MAG: glycosyltransferase [Butyrivibrio sp.]|nr:glycosyltransferase [Butyrivibrio sp.]
MVKQLKTVGVLLSTYNGESTLKRQVDSIFKQKDVNIQIFIRDDGSCDNTCSVINKLCEEYKGKINYIIEENIGYKKSFLKLTSLIGKCDYYCFADQDDIWEEEKLYNAITALENINDPIKLYTSSVKLVNQDLNSIGFNNISNMPNKLEALFTRGRLAGCTFVFSLEVLRLTIELARVNYENNQMPSHDFLVAALAFSCGTVYMDQNSYIKHIRYKDSVTCGKNGLLKRIKGEIYGIFFYKNICLHMAQMLMEYNIPYLHSELIPYLESVVNYKKTIKNRVNLLKNSEMTCGIKVCDWETKFKILIGTF